jgi:hypothetical protein
MVFDENGPNREGVSVESCGPNPFTSSTAVWVALPKPGAVRATVHDVGGRRVASLTSGVHPAGELRVAWDGKTDDGESPGSGLYFIVVDAGGSRASARLMLLR